MYQNPYLPLATLGRSFGSYNGGICQLWYTPIQHLNGFPSINPLTQQLVSEPSLVNGATWYGPINIPNTDLGFEQIFAKSQAGNYFKRKFVANIPGFDSTTYLNIDNTLNHQLCVVAKLRSGGFFIIAGNNVTGLDVEVSDTAGVGIASTPVSTLVIADETMHRSLLLPSFLGVNSQPPTIPGGGSGGGSGDSGANIFEIIDFNTTGDTVINWLTTRQTNYGMYPLIELWEKNANGTYSKANIPIDTVGGNPVTQYIIRNAGGEGKIKIM